MKDNQTHLAAQYYTDMGFALCALYPSTKRPVGDGWQDAPQHPDYWINNPSHGIGIIHHLSGTCSLDLDSVRYSRDALETLGVDLDELMRDSMRIESGREDRSKILFYLPSGVELSRHAINWRLEKGGKPKCILEMRAGRVQDALPPSIHPDTKEPYFFGGSDKIATLPDELLFAWQNIELTRDCMNDAAPFPDAPRIVRATLPRRQESPSVISEFNRQNDPMELLGRYGYKRIGKRALSPYSETRIPGIVRLDDKIYCHHGSDPLCNGHAHDAFSVYTVVEWGGDVPSAVAHAAKDLGMEIEKPVQNVLKAPEQVVESAPELEQIPVQSLRNLESWMRDQLHNVKPDALRAAVIACAAAVVQRHYLTPNGASVGVFVGVVDSSVAGLSELAELSKLVVASVDRLSVRGTDLPSAGVLYSHLIRSPRMFWSTTNFGLMVRKSSRQQSGALDSALNALMTTYSSHKLMIDPDTGTRGGERDISECDIHYPSATVLAFLSADNLSTLNKSTEYGRGTLQQMICTPAGDSVNGHSKARSTPVVPTEVMAVFDALPRDGNLSSGSSASPYLSRVRQSMGAPAIFSAAHARFVEIMSTDARQARRGMAHGYAQSMLRVASVLSIWDNPAAPCIDDEIANWSARYTERCLCLMAPRVEIITDDSAGPDVVSRVQEIMIDSTQEMTARDIARRCRPFGRLSSGEREELLDRMVADGLLLCTGTNYKGGKKYLAPKSVR